MSEEARALFFAGEKKRIALNLRKRKIRKGIITGIGIFIAAFISGPYLLYVP